MTESFRRKLDEILTDLDGSRRKKSYVRNAYFYYFVQKNEYERHVDFFYLHNLNFSSLFACIIQLIPFHHSI